MARLLGDEHSQPQKEVRLARGSWFSIAGEEDGARESCPYVVSGLQKSAGDNGSKSGSLTSKGDIREREPSLSAENLRE